MTNRSAALAIAVVGTLATVGCGSAHARPAYIHTPSSSPYRVELVGEGGATLNTYAHRGRYYVLGSMGQRYSVRISNPTARRVEAVISVDGLDAIDGQDANYQSKRGYVIPPYGSVDIEGFRTSTSQVAAFRFSSVNRSYAGRKGKARNVGVIGVAFFEEGGEPALAVPTTPPRPYDYRKDFYDEEDFDVGDLGGGGPAKSSRAPRESAKPSARNEASADRPSASGEMAPYPSPPPRDYRERSSRPGLGTEFGERRYSSVSWTQFVRRSNRPTAIATLRYNDAAGLQALGINLGPRYDWDEMATRETANPFPGQGFAAPPPGDW